MKTIEKIKAEIDKRYAEYREKMKSDDFTYYEGMADALDLFEQFIDSLESEKPMQEGLEKEIGSYMSNKWKFGCVIPITPVVLPNFTTEDFKKVARHFAEWGKEHAKIDVTDFCKPIDPGIAQCIADHSWEMLGEDEKPVPNDLEEAAKEYAHCPYTDDDGNFYEDAIDGTAYRDFKAGANWQKVQDDRLVDIIYKQGIEKGKDDMKEQAVSGTLAYEPHLRRIIVNLDDIPDGTWNGGGTPVEVIMFKKEQVTKEN